MKIIKEDFQSIQQLLKTLEGRSNNRVMKDSNASKKVSVDFTLTETWEEAMDLLRYGYKDILNDVKKGLRKNARIQGENKRRVIKTAVEGAAPHVPNALLGLPNSMISYETKTRKTRTISIVYIETANHKEPARSFVDAGIALLSAIQTLELKGYRVRLKCMLFCAKCEDEAAFASVNLKDYRDQLDLLKLCFPIAHPSMFRRVGFRWLETVSGLQRHDWNGGYGQPINDEELSKMKGIFEENERFLTLRTIQDCGYNVDRVIERLNLK